VVAVSRSSWVVIFASNVLALFTYSPLIASDSAPGAFPSAYQYAAQTSLNAAPGLERRKPALVNSGPWADSADPYRLKFAYGRTFGTSTQLDYATLELSRRVSEYPVVTVPCPYGPAFGEVELAFLASHVCYKEGIIERIKRLDFRDGYEVGFVPKSRFTIPPGPLGFTSYLESGAGIGYVSETYRNSGSRWNWSLLAGFGLEKAFPERLVVSVVMQWRHLSNGNMWGKGDELHNSYSGTDMIQGMAALVHRF